MTKELMNDVNRFKNNIRLGILILLVLMMLWGGNQRIAPASAAIIPAPFLTLSPPQDAFGLITPDSGVPKPIVREKWPPAPTPRLRVFDKIGFELICLLIPGIIFTFGGIRIIRNRRVISVNRDGQFGWKTPVLLEGKDAVDSGTCITYFGAGLLILGIIAIIGVYQ